MAVAMIECWPEPTRALMRIAEREADRLGHNYIGCEHLLVALGERPGTAAASFLREHGLHPDVIRAELDRLVSESVLPAPWHQDAELLRELGVDLDEVVGAAREAFGDIAVDRAARAVSRRSGWTAACGKAILAKPALHYASEHRRANGHPVIDADELLIGILRDAEAPIDRPRRFTSRRQHRLRSRLGLPQRGPTPVRLIIENTGHQPAALRCAAAALLYPTTGGSNGS